MNTTEFGDVLEKQIYDYLSAMIAADLYWVRKENCKIFWKKGYFSAQRQSDIIFDVAIEVWMPGASEYSLLILIECKRYTTRRVPVGDIEQFFQKVQQVSSGNRKAILASNAAFDSGTRTFAGSNGIALLRYFDPTSAKWELHRPPSLGAKSSTEAEIENIEEALSMQDFTRLAMDLYIQSQSLRTSSFWEFTEHLIRNSELSAAQIHAVANPSARPKNQVPFITDECLEEMTLAVLREIQYEKGEVSLAQICALEEKRSGLIVYLDAPPLDGQRGTVALGNIAFAPLEIRIFEQDMPNAGRERFTLAHELAHHLLGHSEFIAGEYCDASDFALRRSSGLLGPEIARLEYQANVFASCLLMPKRDFIDDFRRIAHSLDIRERGVGPLYVDDQPCNCENFYQVTNALMTIYGVSRAAVSIRLETFDLLNDVRKSVSTRLVSSFLSFP